MEIWYEGERRHTSIGHEAEIRTIAISPDSQNIASGSEDTTIAFRTLCEVGGLCNYMAYTRILKKPGFLPRSRVFGEDFGKKPGFWPPIYKS